MEFPVMASGPSPADLGNQPLKKRIYICVNGILSWPGSSRLWSERAERFITLSTGNVGTTCRYFCGPIGRALFQQRRVEHFREILSDYLAAGWEVHLVGHSNGCDIILQGLAQENWPVVASVHLFSGACSADFHRNGLNFALGVGRIGRLHVYVGGKDQALRLASHSMGRLLGYGVLGLHGPKNVAKGNLERLRVVKVPDYGHSDWWTPENFAQTMGYLV